jgi:hypothetical protein
VLALQDAVEPKMAPEAVVQEDESEVTADMANESAAAADVPDAVECCGEAPEAVVQEDESEVMADMANESVAAADVPDAVERCGEIEVKAMADMAAEMEVDVGRADGEPEEAEETEQARDAGNLIDGDKQEGSDAEGEWEMVTEEPEPAAAPASLSDAPRPQESAGAEILTTETEAAPAAWTHGR